MMKLLVPQSIKLVFVCTLALAPVRTYSLDFSPLIGNWLVSEEIEVGGPIVAHGIEDNSGVMSARTASNGSEYLVVWEGWDAASARQALFGVVLDETGMPRSESFKVISDEGRGGFPSLQPRLASNGNSYLVVFKQSIDTRLVAVNISGDGVVSTSGAVAIPPATSQDDFGVLQWDVESNGEDYVIVWQSRDPTYSTNDPQHRGLYGVRLDGDGSLLTTTPERIVGNVGRFVWISQGPDAGYRVVAHGADGEGAILDLSESMGVRAEYREPSGQAPIYAAVDHDDSNYVLVSFRAGQNVPPSLFARTQGPDVEIDEVDEFEIVRDYPTGDFSLATGNRNNWVLWRDTRSSNSSSATEIYGARLSPNGQVLDLNGVLIAGGQRDLRILDGLASNRKSFLAVYQDNKGTGNRSDDTINAKLILSTDDFPMMLSMPTLGQNDLLSFQFNAAPGGSFEVQYSDDLNEWFEQETFQNFPGEAVVTDSTPSPTGQRFYRARRLP